eukprot:TRINITY_DN84_c0_g1_i3.p1 TRINITY_DN84_c0_g1~~TRINITY_DN84_c0_g1_i3.p1  ORF type:complete len:249 (+),score=40.15 TRINITY_DN84_c0_g1_i3:358-1104(+)
MNMDRFGLEISETDDQDCSKKPTNAHMNLCVLAAVSMHFEEAKKSSESDYEFMTERYNKWLEWSSDGADQTGDWSMDGITYKMDLDRFTDPDPHEIDESSVNRVNGRWGSDFELLQPTSGNMDNINWMRTAALPNFRKLHRIIKNTTLKKGEWLKVTVANFWDQTLFGGSEKTVVLATTGALGGTQWVLFVFLLLAAAICLTTAVLVGCMRLRCERQMGQRELDNKIRESDGIQHNRINNPNKAEPRA